MKINKEILQLAIPNIISNLSIPLLSSVDTALMGRLSEGHISAVGIGAMIFNLIYWNFGFLRMGTTGMAAQAYGQENKTEIIQTLFRALFLAMAISFLVLLLQWPFREISYYLMNVSTEQATLVSDYFNIRIWAAPASLASFVLMGWFFGMQNVIYPLILTIVVNIVNIVFNYLFVIEWGMEIDGVAYATVIAQYTGLFLGLFLFYFSYREYLEQFTLKTMLAVEKIKRFFAINGDIFIRTICLTFTFGFFYSQSTQMGDTLLAVNVILLQFINWMSYFIDGFAYAAESLVGKYVGAQNTERLKKIIRMSFVWGTIMAILFSLLYGFGGVYLFSIFTTQQQVIDAAIPYLFWMALIPIAGYASYIWDGIYIGLTATRTMRNTMLLSLVIFLGSYYLFQQIGSNNGLWLSFLLFLFARGALQSYYYWKRGISID